MRVHQHRIFSSGCAASHARRPFAPGRRHARDRRGERAPRPPLGPQGSQNPAWIAYPYARVLAAGQAPYASYHRRQRRHESGLQACRPRASAGVLCSLCALCSLCTLHKVTPHPAPAPLGTMRGHRGGCVPSPAQQRAGTHPPPHAAPFPAPLPNVLPKPTPTYSSPCPLPPRPSPVTHCLSCSLPRANLHVPSEPPPPSQPRRRRPLRVPARSSSSASPPPSTPRSSRT